MEDNKIEIINIAPSLIGIPKIQVLPPSHYFDKMQDEIMQQLAHPIEKNSLDAPEGYFENMQNEVLSKIAAPKKSVITLRSWMAVAASLILLITCVSIFNNNMNQNNKLTVSEFVANLDDEELIQMLESESEHLGNHTALENNLSTEIAIEDLMSDSDLDQLILDQYINSEEAQEIKELF